MENILEFQHVTKKYKKDFTAVSDFNLQIKKGEFVTLLGPSGCGKTTTLRMIAGFEMPTDGKILLEGQDISVLPPNKRPINTVFQRYALFPHLNIYDNIAFGLKLKKLSKKDIEQKVKKVLEMVDLEGFEKRKVNTLSGGQQQRIAIARALVNEPDILLLDEPLGALDLKMREEMQIELKAMHERLGITFIYVTHDQQEALSMSDKIVVMNKGQIQQVGTSEDVYNEPANAFVADFIGQSNIFNGLMNKERHVTFCGVEFECVDDIPEGEPVDVVVRPEDIRISDDGEGHLQAKVQSVIFKGIHYEITTYCGENEILVQSTKCPKVGETIGLIIDPFEIHVIPVKERLNRFDCILKKDYSISTIFGPMSYDLTELFAGSAYKDGVLVDRDGEEIKTKGIRLSMTIPPTAIEMSDDIEEGIISGHIRNLIYKGDHYQYIVETDDKYDIFLDDEYLWNMDDRVSLKIAKEDIHFSLKNER